MMPVVLEVWVLSEEENKRMTQVGPGTPMGDLLRRYWQPIAAVAELAENPTKEVKLLGEELVLYKDLSGNYGLINRYCAHRAVNMAFGIPEANGLRCMYHGWLYNESGQCTEQPFDDRLHPEAKFKDRIRLKAYPVEALAGLLYTYMGPLPAPLLPNYEPLVRENVVRDISFTILPCNWLQSMENSVDPAHVEWLHLYMTNALDAQMGGGKIRSFFPEFQIKKIAFDVFEHGIIKRRVLEGRTEDDDDWKVGHPLIFPNSLLATGNSDNYQIIHYRVPIDDFNTLNAMTYIYTPAPGHKAPVQDRVPYRYVPLKTPEGEWNRNWLSLEQDKMVWVEQGPVARRDQEHLSSSDTGIILYRKVLKEQMEIVAKGGEPMAVVRDPSKNVSIELGSESTAYGTAKASKFTALETGQSADQEKIEHVLGTWAEPPLVQA